MKVQNLRKLLSLAERPATGLNLPQISFNAEATQISKRICRNSGRGQAGGWRLEDEGSKRAIRARSLWRLGDDQRRSMGDQYTIKVGIRSSGLP